MGLTADELIGLLATFSWVINLAHDEREALFTEARRLLKEFLGVEGDVTVDVDFRVTRGGPVSKPERPLSSTTEPSPTVTRSAQLASLARFSHWICRRPNAHAAVENGQPDRTHWGHALSASPYPMISGTDTPPKSHRLREG